MTVRWCWGEAGSHEQVAVPPTNEATVAVSRGSKGPEAAHALEHALGYRFNDRALLESALTHKSYANEQSGLERNDNERLEFLGDAVVDLVVGHMLMERFPELREGQLSMMRAQVVSEAGLTIIARDLGIGDFLYLGKGESQTGGRDKPSLLADATEALVAAVYLDGGFEAAQQVVRRLFAPHVASAPVPGHSDYKTRLQELAQAAYKEPPRYEVIGEEGPDHNKTFAVAVILRDEELARATGKSKKEAEQRAAEQALQTFAGDNKRP
jgi:ribonuclease III